MVGGRLSDVEAQGNVARLGKRLLDNLKAPPIDGAFIRDYVEPFCRAVTTAAEAYVGSKQSRTLQAALRQARDLEVKFETLKRRHDPQLSTECKSLVCSILEIFGIRGV